MTESVPRAPLLLDTHIWVWVMEGEAKALASSVIDDIERASEEGRVRLAAISVWEVAMLVAKGRLRLSLGVDEWVQRALAAPGVQLVPLTPEISIGSTRLPGNGVGDPVDRILIATARQIGAVLVTRDRLILDYSASGHVRALDAIPTPPGIKS